jgi:hypothetical protein
MAFPLRADGAYDSAIAPLASETEVFKSAEKIYIRATRRATGAYDFGSGREGAFKTLVAYGIRLATRTTTSSRERTCGGGVPIVASFPLKDADPEWRYSRYYYQITEDGHYKLLLDFVGIGNTWYNMGKYNSRRQLSTGVTTSVRYGQATYKPNQAYW